MNLGFALRAEIIIDGQSRNLCLTGRKTKNTLLGGDFDLRFAAALNVNPNGPPCQGSGR